MIHLMFLVLKCNFIFMRWWQNLSISLIKIWRCQFCKYMLSIVISLRFYVTYSYIWFGLHLKEVNYGYCCVLVYSTLARGIKKGGWDLNKHVLSVKRPIVFILTTIFSFHKYFLICVIFCFATCRLIIWYMLS